MFAHVVSFQAPVEQLEGIAMRGFQERVVPVLRELVGLQETLILLDRAQGELLAINLWDTEEHARTAAKRLERERGIGVEEIGATSAPIKLYEVVVHTTP